MMPSSTPGATAPRSPLLRHHRKRFPGSSSLRIHSAALLLLLLQLLALLLLQSVAAADLERRNRKSQGSSNINGHKSKDKHYAGVRDGVTEVHGEWPRYYDALLRPYARYDHVNIIPHRKHVVRFLGAAREHGGNLQPSTSVVPAKDDFWGLFSVPGGKTLADSLAHSSLGTRHREHVRKGQGLSRSDIEHELSHQRHRDREHERDYEHEHTRERDNHNYRDEDDEGENADDDVPEHASLHSNAVHVRAGGQDATRRPCNTDDTKTSSGHGKIAADAFDPPAFEQCEEFQQTQEGGRRYVEANGVDTAVKTGSGNLRGHEVTDPNRDLATTGLANVWMFWESVTSRSGYLDLCERSVRAHSRGLQVHLLDKAAVRRLLPTLPDDLDALLPGLAQYSDYVRLALLAKFGGIWLDSDIVVLQDLRQVLDRMCEHGGDFAGFGCTLGLHDRTPCTDNYRHPSNWAMASKAGGQLATWCLKEADRMLDGLRHTLRGSRSAPTDPSPHGKRMPAKQHYAAFGRELLARFFATHPDYNYYHFPSRCMDRDAAGHIISSSAYVLPVDPNNYHREHHNLQAIQGEHGKSELAQSSPRRGCSEAAEDMPLLLPLYNTAGHSTAAWSAFKNLTAAEILVGGGKKLKLGQHDADAKRKRGRSRRRNVDAFDTLGDVAALAHGPEVDIGTGFFDASRTYLASIFRLALAPGDELVAHAHDGV
eukprot:INCI6128.1.p1 GENE.INCI6128.1~~INCI6128.1.p1  ORF type:complete len:710 (-),score=121.47 INCI6128.1:2022-4151(-)